MKDETRKRRLGTSMFGKSFITPFKPNELSFHGTILSRIPKSGMR
jgi:hypothetical protein